MQLQMLDLLEQRMKAMTEQLACAFELTAEIEFRRNYPPTINHPAETEFVRSVLTDMVGAETVQEF